MNHTIIPQLQQVKKASAQIRGLDTAQKAAILTDLADRLLRNEALIIEENKKDLDLLPDTDPKKDRLLLNHKRINNLADSLRQVAQLKDPCGEVLLERTIEQGLQLKKIAVPMGVVGVIYESRPNVTIDVAALCLMSGNACVLKGGKEAEHSNQFLIQLIHESLATQNIDSQVVMLLPTDRQFLTELLTASRYVDIIIPRGSDALIQFVRKNSSIPTIETGAGVCHAYIETSADLSKARDIVVNARVSRPSVCNSLDTVVVDAAIASEFLPMLIPDFIKWNVEVFADEIAFDILKQHKYPQLQAAQEADFGREFLDYKCSIKIVEGINDALMHLETYSSKHSEAIVSQNQELITKFLNEVDSASVYANASTRFTDGEVFGLGAEIGISTQKLHARGPFALEKLVTEKWVIVGDGQVRW
jgi:glutamate-5-semialdehyde dehydrogenase